MHEYIIHKIRQNGRLHAQLMHSNRKMCGSSLRPSRPIRERNNFAHRARTNVWPTDTLKLWSSSSLE